MDNKKLASILASRAGASYWHGVHSQFAGPALSYPDGEINYHLPVHQVHGYANNYFEEEEYQGDRIALEDLLSSAPQGAELIYYEFGYQDDDQVVVLAVKKGREWALTDNFGQYYKAV